MTTIDLQTKRWEGELMVEKDPRLLLLARQDNVFVAISHVINGEKLQVGGVAVVAPQTIPLGFKVAARHILAGEKIVKYGAPIGSATRDIEAGEMVHLHNMKSDYLPTFTFDGEAFHETGH